MRKLRPASAVLAVLLIGAGFAFVLDGSLEERAERLAQALQIESGDIVADVGAGDGEWSVELAAIVGSEGHVFATEVSKKAIKKIERRVSKNGLENVSVVHGDQNRTGLPAGCCDAILLRLVYHHFEHPKKMQADLLRALKPGKLIAIVDFSPENNLGRSNVPEFRGGHGVAAERVIEEMKTAGFRFVERRNRWDDHGNRYLLLFRKPLVVELD